MDKSINKGKEGGREEWKGRREAKRELGTETKGEGESRSILDIQITVNIMPKRFWPEFCKQNAHKK